MSAQAPTSDQPAAPRPPSTRRRHHIEMLVVAILVVIASFVLNVGAGAESERVNIAGTRLKLPPLCASKAFFNFECPGCGLTRGFVHLAHGRVHESLAVNRVAWLLALALVASIPYRILAIYRHEALPLGALVPRLLAWVLITALIGNWLLKQFGL